jgi:hypothetical protein
LNKQLPYILAALLLAAVVLLFLTGSNKKNRGFDSRVTLRKQDKIPYGTYVAYKNLEYIFPKAAIYTSRREPGYWDSVHSYNSGQVYIVISNLFTASEAEMKKIIDFAENGNDVFISARYVSADADKILGCTTSSYDLGLYIEEGMNEKMQVSLSNPPFTGNTIYHYPGKKFNTYFSSIDTATTEVLGHDEDGNPNFIQLKAGHGNLYVQLEPLAFSNYFLLHRENISYYENAMSLLNEDAKKVVWDEYYLYKRRPYDRPEKKKSWLGVLFRYPSLKAALLTAILTLIIYALLEMRRKQRIIPVLAKPRNDSMDFVKTIGRLYYDKGDHKNLSRKMAAYFLEHVRNRYKLTTVNLDDLFVKNLQFKTNCEEYEIRSIVSFIKYIEDAPVIDHRELSDFHKQLEAFYKKT